MVVQLVTERFCISPSDIRGYCVDAVANGTSHPIRVWVGPHGGNRFTIGLWWYGTLEITNVNCSVFAPGANEPTIFQSTDENCVEFGLLDAMVHPCDHVLLQLECSVDDECCDLPAYFANVMQAINRGDFQSWPKCNSCNPPPAPQPVEPEVPEIPPEPQPHESDLDAFTNGHFQNDHMTDFHIKVEDELFWVHRVVLSLKSSVFRRMLVPGTKEAKDKYVEVTESTPDEMRCFLTSLYDYEALPNYETNARALLGMYPLAEEYNSVKIRQFCENALRTVPIENDDFCFFVQRAHCFTALEFLMDRLVGDGAFVIRQFCENALRTVPIENDDFCFFVQRAHCFTALEFLMDRLVGDGAFVIRQFCENALRTVPIENDDFCFFVQRAHCFTALEFLMDRISCGGAEAASSSVALDTFASRCVEAAPQLPPGYFKQGDGKQLMRSDAGESLVERMAHRPVPAASSGHA